MSSQPGASRRRAALFAAVSLLLAFGTAAGVLRIINSYESLVDEAKRASETVPVVAAARTLEPGLPIAAEDVGLVSVLPSSLPTDAKDAFFDNTALVLGAVPRERVLVGEPVRRERLEGPLPQGTLTATITEGWRAVTVKVEKAMGVGGLLKPGDRVDLIVTIRPDDASLGANWVTETILQNALVLAVGDLVYGSAPPPADDDEASRRAAERTALVTLEVLPEEAEKVALASARGSLHLTLRRVGDAELMDASGPTVTNALLGISKGDPERVPTRRRIRPAKPPETPAASTVEVIQGPRSSVQQYDAEGRRLPSSGK